MRPWNGLHLQLRSKGHILLGCTALFAMLWAIARASVQAVTIDEADNYLIFVDPDWPAHWVASPNNHVLNTLLMRLFTAVFGLSHLTVRLPALIGAAIYISVAYYLSRLVTRDWKLQCILFVCLVYNPFLFDYLVAARGYGLATAFLLCAIAIPASFQLQNMSGRVRPMSQACVLSSACAALSFAANFSLAFVDVAAMSMTFLWACQRAAALQPVQKQRIKDYARLLAACLFPGLLVTLFLTLSVVLKFPKAQLFYGATSLRETLSTIIDNSFYELNPYIVSPWLYPIVERIRPYLLPLLGAACCFQLILIFFNRASIRDAHAKWLSSLGKFLGAVVILTISVHWLSFRLFDLLLPKDRTGLFLVPLCTLIAGIFAAIPHKSRTGHFGRVALTGLLLVIDSYFLLCLRLDHFKVWQFDADTKNVYFVLAYYNHRYGVRDVASSWMYVPSLNFYRKLSGQETLAPLAATRQYPVDRSVYVLFPLYDDTFMREQGLKVVYRGEQTPVVVAIRPGVESTPR